MRVEEGPKNILFVHVTLAPSLDVVGEQKTKPTQHSVQELRRIGIQPDLLAVRCTNPLEEKTKQKIALFTNVETKDVISCHDVKSIFMVPQILYEQGVIDTIFKKFDKIGLVNTAQRWDKWTSIVHNMTNHADGKIKIAMIGKYVTLSDSYVSVNHALRHAGAQINKSVSIDWIDSECLEHDNNNNKLQKYDGIIIPGGFGARGSEGIIQATNFAMKHDTPYLGICFGFQLAAIAFGRNVCNYSDANSTEINQDTKNPIVGLLPEQQEVTDMGGSLRLGANDVQIKDGSLARRIYGTNVISKRHRHRYEINKDYINEFADKGLVFTGQSDNNKRMEILEIPKHRFFLGVQFHPEFNSRPGFPEEAFEAFIKASATTSN